MSLPPAKYSASDAARVADHFSRETEGTSHSFHQCSNRPEPGIESPGNSIDDQLDWVDNKVQEVA